MARKGENIFKRKDGRWEGRYIRDRVNGKAVYGYVFGKTYSEVKAKKNKAIAAKIPQTPTSATTEPLLKDIATQWLEDLKAIRKKSTIAKYKGQLQKYITPNFGNLCINKITNSELVNFSRKLLSGCNGRVLSPRTVADILSRMKSIRKFALLQGYNIGYTSDFMSVPQDKKTIRVLTTREQEILINYLNTKTDAINLGLLLCLSTGLRIGELCALKWDDISISEGELHVRRTMQRLQNLDKTQVAKTYIDIGEPKSKCSVRTIPLPNSIVSLLKTACVSGAYLLTGQKSYFIEPRTMENRFKRVLKECGIEKANFHSLRHTFATRCVEVGFDIKSLSEILGHANVNITLNRYVHPTMKLKRENMNKLSELFAVK